MFCSIVGRSATADEVLRDDHAVAFLDRSPVFEGHVLVVPPAHVVTLADLPQNSIGPFFERVQRIAAVLPDALGCDGTWVSMNNIVSQSVAHLHVHVVPRRRKDGLRGFYWPRQKYSDQTAAQTVASSIRNSLNADHRRDVAS